ACFGRLLPPEPLLPDDARHGLGTDQPEPVLCRLAMRSAFRYWASTKRSDGPLGRARDPHFRIAHLLLNDGLGFPGHATVGGALQWGQRRKVVTNADQDGADRPDLPRSHLLSAGCHQPVWEWRWCR